MKRLLITLAGAVVLSTALADWDGESWVFDTSGRQESAVISESSSVVEIDPAGHGVSVSSDGLALDHGWYTFVISDAFNAYFGRPGFLLFFR